MENSERTNSNVTKSGKKGNMELNQFFQILGIIFIIIYFAIFIRFDGPYITSYEKIEQNSSITIELQIWVIYIYIGCAALFIGFLIKFLSEVRDSHQQPRFMVYLGVIMTSANILTFHIYQTLEWFKGIYIPILHLLAPIFFILAVAVSIIYLVLPLFKRLVHSQAIT